MATPTATPTATQTAKLLPFNTHVRIILPDILNMYGRNKSSLPAIDDFQLSPAHILGDSILTPTTRTLNIIINPLLCYATSCHVVLCQRQKSA